MMASVNISVTGKVSKNCGSCLGRHPPPFGKSCQYMGVEDVTMSETEQTAGVQGERLPGASPASKSPLPSKEEHLKKLLAKEEEKKDKLEEQRRVVQLEHQLATIRIANKDIVRDIEETDTVAASLGVHSGTTTFRGSRQGSPAGASASGTARVRGPSHSPYKNKHGIQSENPAPNKDFLLTPGQAAEKECVPEGHHCTTHSDT